MQFQLFVAIGRTSKLSFAQLYEKANRNTTIALLKYLLCRLNGIEHRLTDQTSHGRTDRSSG
jgi:hypothetical protein